eukprot:1883152-Rhodomonas_salina.1
MKAVRFARISARVALDRAALVSRSRRITSKSTSTEVVMPARFLRLVKAARLLLTPNGTATASTSADCVLTVKFCSESPHARSDKSTRSTGGGPSDDT